MEGVTEQVDSGRTREETKSHINGLGLEKPLYFKLSKVLFIYLSRGGS